MAPRTCTWLDAGPRSRMVFPRLPCLSHAQTSQKFPFSLDKEAHDVQKPGMFPPISAGEIILTSLFPTLLMTFQGLIMLMAKYP